MLCMHMLRLLLTCGVAEMECCVCLCCMLLTWGVAVGSDVVYA